MSHHRSLDNLKLDRSWLTIGVFDGVHRGHQVILRRLVAGAHAEGLPAVVVTFFPSPAVVLRDLRDPVYLSMPDERAELLAALGVDEVVTLEFNRQLASLPAADFMAWMKARLGIVHLCAGFDFALGHAREGNLPMLKQIGDQLGFTVTVVDPVADPQNGAISSSRIRNLVANGEVRTAADLLGRRYAVNGVIAHGDGRGHGLGFPTANIAIPQQRLSPGFGIYATWIILRGQRFPSVTSIGVRPTFEQAPVAPRIEAHILDLPGDPNLYDQPVRLEFVEYLRPEMRFSQIQDLIDQIHQDIQQSREVLSRDR
ncbi:MAG: bifunctional riboflavin kinase/FAD synthetase [Chloroflexi bacterium]|nr:bifunctional riboflavin kinase/FAD synthetase [Chloroflexota bacterium]